MPMFWRTITLLKKISKIEIVNTETENGFKNQRDILELKYKIT